MTFCCLVGLDICLFVCLFIGVLSVVWGWGQDRIYFVWLQFSLTLSFLNLFTGIQAFNFGEDWYCILRTSDHCNVHFHCRIFQRPSENNVLNMLKPSDIWDVSILFFHSCKIITKSPNYISKAKTLLQVSYFGIRD